MDKKTDTVADTGLVNQSLVYFTRAIELLPTYHDAFGNRGLTYFRLGQYYRRLQQFSTAEAHYNQAYNDYQTALRHRPNDDKALSNLGYIYAMRQQLDSAEIVYRHSLAINPRFIEAHRNLGAVLAMKKQFPQAIEQWQEGLKYEPEDPALLRYIGSAYKDMGQLEKAQLWFERAAAAQK